MSIATISNTWKRYAQFPPDGALIAIMTHSHALDLELARAILAREDFDYFGLIGSASKRVRKSLSRPDACPILS